MISIAQIMLLVCFMTRPWESFVKNVQWIHWHSTCIVVHRILFLLSVAPNHLSVQDQRKYIVYFVNHFLFCQRSRGQISYSISKICQLFLICFDTLSVFSAAIWWFKNVYPSSLSFFKLQGHIFQMPCPSSRRQPSCKFSRDVKAVTRCHYMLQHIMSREKHDSKQDGVILPWVWNSLSSAVQVIEQTTLLYCSVFVMTRKTALFDYQIDSPLKSCTCTSTCIIC